MSNSWLSFDPVYSGWVVAPILLLLTALLFWKEFRRRNKFLPIRLLANFLMLVAILGILLQPSCQVPRATDAVLLLTKDYDRAQADSLLRKEPSLLGVTAPDADPYPGSRHLKSYQEIGLIAAQIKFVAGEGLPPYALELVGPQEFSFIPSKVPSGIVGIAMPDKIVVNKPYKLKGSYHSSGNARLRLIGPGGVEDSVQFTEAGTFPFEFSFKARQPGRLVYKCVEISKANVEQSHDLPMVVEPERQLRILFIQKFPTAEVRQLKNFLAEKGHSLALRYQISRNTFNYDYANMDRIRIDRLNAALLSTFDLLFIDSDVLSELGDADRNGLYEAVKQGLGMTLLLNELPRNQDKLARFFPPIKGKSNSDTVHLRLATESYSLPVLPVQINTIPSVQAVTVHGKNILSGYQLTGFGKIAFQLLRETYRIRLEGNDSGYSSVWSELVERTARERREHFKVRINNRLPYYTNEPLDVQFLSDGQQPTLMSDDVFTPLAEDVMIDDLWRGKVWADDPGWHQLTIREDSSRFDYYVSPENEWRALRAANQIAENKLHNSTDGATHDHVARYESRRISSLLFFVSFLIASAFLWLAPKI